MTTSTPPAGSMSVVVGSTVSLPRVATKIVFGTVIGRVFALGGAATSTRTRPVAFWSPSVTRELEVVGAHHVALEGECSGVEARHDGHAGLGGDGVEPQRTVAAADVDHAVGW